jgi:EpsI family protein
MSGSTGSLLRFLLVVFLIGGTGLFLRARSGAEDIPDRQPFPAFPNQIDGWTGKDIKLLPDTLRVLGSGEFLHRVYFRSANEPYIDLFLAYFPTQRTGSTWHSPQNCLPGAGWVPTEGSRIQVQAGNGHQVTVNRYIIAKGLERQLVHYWYQAHGRVVASEYWAKFYLVADAVRLNRSDGALVRVVTPVSAGEDLQAADRRLTQFSQAVLGRLDPYIPR